MDKRELALAKHAEWRGKLSVEDQGAHHQQGGVGHRLYAGG